MLRAVKDLENNGDGHVRRGRHGYLDARSDYKQLHNQVTNASMPLDATKGYFGLNKLVRKVVDNKNPNNYAPPVTVPARTLYNISKRIDSVQVQAEIKNETRVASHDMLRSNIADVCMIRSISKISDPSLFFSSDDVSVCFGENTKPTCITTKEALAWLNDHLLAVSTKTKKVKKRVITYNVTIGARNGKRLCVVIKIADRNFTDLTEKPKIYNMGEGIYVMLYHAAMKEEIVQREMYDKVICRAARKERDSIINREQVGFTALATDDSDNLELAAIAADQLQEQYNEEIRKKYQWITLASDGQIAQIKGLETLNQKWQIKQHNIVIAKYSAGCSLEESPNDVGPMHRTLKACFNSTEFLYEGDIPDPAGECWTQLKQILKSNLESASFNIIFKALRYSPTFIDKAFNEDAIRKGFRDSGIFPINEGYQLSKNPFFSNLEQSKADHVIQQLAPLTLIMDEKGYIPDESFQALLNDTKQGTDNYEPKTKGKQLNDMSVSRQYAMILTNPAFNSDKQQRADAAAAKKAPSTNSQSNNSKHSRKRKLNQDSLEEQDDDDSNENPANTSSKQHLEMVKLCCNQSCRKEIYCSKSNASEWMKCTQKWCR